MEDLTDRYLLDAISLGGMLISLAEAGEYQCTDDTCAPATGCVYTNNTASCDDGNACTTSDTCSGGTCVGGPPPTCKHATASPGT